MATMMFYSQCCWAVIKDDLYDALLYFFEGHAIPQAFSASLVVLIPKSESPMGLSGYRPISL